MPKAFFPDSRGESSISRDHSPLLLHERTENVNFNSDGDYSPNNSRLSARRAKLRRYRNKQERQLVRVILDNDFPPNTAISKDCGMDFDIPVLSKTSNKFHWEADSLV